MHALGVDVGGTKIAAGVVDGSGKILARQECPTPGTPEQIDAAIAGLYRLLAGSHPVDRVGIAAAGLISSDRTTAMFAPNLPWRSYPLGTRVGSQIGPAVSLVVENDANAAGWAEYRFGAGRGRDMLMLTIGTGVGGAIIAGGRLLRGAFGAAAEVGHLQIVADGFLCGCGQRGCLEAYASGPALERMATEALTAQPERAARLRTLADPGGAVRGRHVAAAAAEGDELSLDLLDRLGRWAGRGAASLVAVLDPAVIVVGGGVASVGELLLAGIRRGLADHLTARDRRPTAEVVAAKLGNDAGLVGAADLARPTD